MDTNTNTTSTEGSSSVRLYPCSYCNKQVANPCIHQSQADRCGKSFKIIRWKPLLNFQLLIKQLSLVLTVAAKRIFA